MLEFRRGWVGVVSVLQAEPCNTDTTPKFKKNNSGAKWLREVCRSGLICGRMIMEYWHSEYRDMLLTPGAYESQAVTDA